MGDQRQHGQHQVKILVLVVTVGEGEYSVHPYSDANGYLEVHAQGVSVSEIETPLERLPCTLTVERRGEKIAVTLGPSDPSSPGPVDHQRP